VKHLKFSQGHTAHRGLQCVKNYTSVHRTEIGSV